MSGKVLWFEPSKGYGFIRGTDGKDYFAHASEIGSHRDLTRDQAVTFDPAQTERGRRAKEIVET